MDAETFVSLLLAGGTAVALIVYRLAGRSSLDRFGDDDEGGRGPPIPRLDPSGFAVTVPWAEHPAARRFDLRWGIDSVEYQPAVHDDQGQLVTPEVVYTRYSVIALGDRLPSLRAAMADASPAFADLLRAMASIDGFPSPEGMGLAFVDHDIPRGTSPRLRFQQLLDTAWVRLIGEAEALVYLRQVARESSDHGAACARLLLTHFAELAAADGLPRIWSRQVDHIDTALAACVALRAEDDDPLFALAIGRHIDPDRTDVMEAAWHALAASLTPRRLFDALESDAPVVFADAARRARADGLQGVDDGIIRVGDAKPSHRPAAAELLGRSPASDADGVLVGWMVGSDRVRADCARALKARGSTAASSVLVGWLMGEHDADVDFAVQWLGALGAADAVGPLRACRERWGGGSGRTAPCEAAIAGILARTGAADGALAFADATEGALALADAPDGGLALADADGIPRSGGDQRQPK